MIYVLNGDVVHHTLEQYPQTKKVHDHDYIARLLRFELEKVADEVEHLENFYGKCHPMPLEEVTAEGCVVHMCVLLLGTGESGHLRPRGCLSLYYKY
ncbi:PRKG1 [Symbiodinium natans]|uniref:PRKG1 protein n=1 Tax=Symbiodinium natans TaxID=878477 RepID=A0A812QS76_9DINO|nr:PRKG1 [Symbiodinium natans]